MSSIVIGVRVRPFNQREIKFNSTNIVAMPPNKPGSVSLKVVRQGKILNETPKEFNFDHAFWTHDGEGGMLPDGSPATNTWADQQRVYEQLGRPVLKNVLDGYNATLFAYGQTGSGKTYTMMGYPPGDVGVTPRICDELFSSLAEMGAEADEFQLATECSYLEIYNEEVHDLLAKERSEHGLKVRQHPKTGVFVEGLKKVIVTQANDVLTILNDGNTARTVASTNMNASSSRSHAVVTLTVSLTMTKNGIIQGKYAKLILVDLAGSERASSTGATGGTLVEGANINKSLSTLGMVLGRLADQAETGKSLPVPFRDSSLTFLLHDSFGGNSKTAMIANISPADVNYDETLSTLRFAAVTKRVKNKAIVNENPAAKLIRELTEELAGLKDKLSALRTKKIDNNLPSNTEQEGDEEAALNQLIEDGLAAQGSLAMAADTVDPTAAVDALKDEGTVTKDFLSANSDNSAMIFVDWHKPHLINLCPESRTLIMTVAAGDAYVIIGDASNPASNIVLSPAMSGGKACAAPEGAYAKIHYSPLLNNVAIERLASQDASAGVFVNGSEVTKGTAMPLEHGDRLAIGSLLMRVSHTTNIPTAVPYSKLYMCEEHVFLAEAYHRQYVIHKWASGLSAMVREVGGGSGALDIDGSPRRGGDPSEESPFAAVVNTDHVEDATELEVCAVNDMRQAENELVSQFPVSNSELASYAKEYQDKNKRQDARKRSLSTAAGMSGSFVSSPTSPSRGPSADEEQDVMLIPMLSTDPTAEQMQEWSREGHAEYLQAKKEHEEALLAQQAMIDGLKLELEALKLSKTKESAPSDEVVISAQEPSSVEDESEAVEKALAIELKWHQEVKLMRVFRVTGPSDEKDAFTWRTYAEGSKGTFPFLSQLHAEQERFYEASVGESTKDRSDSTSDAQLSADAAAAKQQAFLQRFGRRGTFLKMKQNKEKWDLRYFIIIDHFLYYFQSCVGTFRCLGALYLKGSTINYVGAHGGQEHVVLVKLAAPRRADEPKENSFYFAFVKQKDAALWCHWMSIASIPPMPVTMKDRLEKEATLQFSQGGIRLDTHHQFYPVNPLLLGLTDLVVTTEGDLALGAWKNDEMVTHCENCEGKFTFFNRRHHCRACGGIFCGTCAPKFGKDNERTCVSCQGGGAAKDDDIVTAVLEEPSIGVPAAVLDDDSSQK